MKAAAIASAIIAMMVGCVVAQPMTGMVTTEKTVMAQGNPMMDWTPEQMQKFDGLRTSFLKETGPLETDLQVKQIELGELWRMDNLDAKKITAKAKEISDVRAKLDMARVNMHINMAGLFTPEQRKKMMMRMGMMGGGMMGGMGQMMGGMGMGNQMGMMGQSDGSMGQMGPQSCPDCMMH